MYILSRLNPANDGSEELPTNDLQTNQCLDDPSIPNTGRNKMSEFPLVSLDENKKMRTMKSEVVLGVKDSKGFHHGPPS